MFVLFDIGGTKTRISKTDSFESIGEIMELDTPECFKDGVDVFTETVKNFCSEGEIQAVVGGIAGPLDEQKSSLSASPNLPDWTKEPLSKELEDKLDAPVALENDTALSGLGEAHYGSGKDFRIVVYMTISTGVGGVRIVNGKIDENRIGFEIGHQIMNLNSDGVAEGRGGQSRLEDLISGTALERKYGKPPYEITDKEVWNETARLTAYGIHNTILHWSPDIVVLGGSMVVGDGVTIDLEKVKEYLGEANYILPHLPEIAKAKNGSYTGLWGALAYLRQLKEEGIL